MDPFPLPCHYPAVPADSALLFRSRFTRILLYQITPANPLHPGPPLEREGVLNSSPCKEFQTLQLFNNPAPMSFMFFADTIKRRSGAHNYPFGK